MRKPQIDRVVASITGISQRQVTTVTDAFIRELMSAIITEDEVVIQGFGIFHLVLQRAGGHVRTLTTGTGKKGQSTGTLQVIAENYWRVNFRKARAFKEQIALRTTRKKKVKHVEQ
jgi:nucleoid DNA-binding protein